jgi:uncharacterized cupin superfamily protein
MPDDQRTAALDPGTLPERRGSGYPAPFRFVFVVDGELALVTDAGEQPMRPGMVAGFPAGRADGHHLINRSDQPATYLKIGSRRRDVDEVVYSDIDMELRLRGGNHVYMHKNGEPY